MFCELCGMQYLPRQSVCSYCRRPPTRHWLQLISVTMLAIALACNSLVALFLLPRLVLAEQPPALFLIWLRIDEVVALYGWVAVAMALLVWAYWPRYGYQPEREMRIARILLIFLLAASLGVLVLSILPGDAPAGIQAAIRNHPAMALTAAWSVVILAVGVLCLNNETRDMLLGTGRVLSLIAVGLLLLVLVLILLGWGAV